MTVYKVISDKCNFVDFIRQYSCQNIVIADCEQSVNNIVNSERQLIITTQK